VVSADLLLHPVRLRILQAFLGDRALTTTQLAAELDDVPPGSLYRHVARLVDAGVLTVANEQRVRGAVERTYALGVTSALVGPDELAAMTPDEHRTAFQVFVASLLAGFDRYLARGDVDLPRDGVSYRVTALWLDDAELAQLRAEIGALFAPYLRNQRRAGRRRRLLGTVLLPAAEERSTHDTD
jgi:DNA-binding transcriptional ArsR family regulator